MKNLLETNDVKPVYILAADLLSFIRSGILAADVDFSFDTPLEKVGIDSFSLLEILLYLEREHGIFIPDEDLAPDNISTVGRIAETACARSLLK